MVLLLMLLFNWLVMFLSLDIVWSLAHDRVTNYQLFLFIGVSFVIVVGLAFLFNSPIGQWILRMLSGARKTIAREDAKINPVIEQVQQAILERHGLKNLNVCVMVVDNPIPNVFAIGKNTLVVSRAMYETATLEEFAGVIAHEFGHLHNGDSNKLGIALGVSVVSMMVALAASAIATVIEAFSRICGATKSDAGAFMVLFGFIFTLMALFFTAFVYAGNGMLKLAMLFVGRRQEYKADQFAIQAGFGAGLLSFLDKLKNMQFDAPKNLFARLYETHPPTMLRIGEVEKAMQL
jgi:Zn-dependent protease with chaperone function